MGSRIFSTVSFFLLTVALVSGATPNDNMMNNLLKRCDEGIAAACFDYGKSLGKIRGQTYFRRACTLAYQPACQHLRAPVNSKLVKSPKPKLDPQGNPCNGHAQTKASKYSLNGNHVVSVTKGSVWEQSGFQIGDKIVSVNGEPFKNARQINTRLNEGGAVINVSRNGRETSLMVRCP